jgi:hypothetical protein
VLREVGQHVDQQTNHHAAAESIAQLVPDACHTEHVMQHQLRVEGSGA